MSTFPLGPEKRHFGVWCEAVNQSAVGPRYGVCGDINAKWEMGNQLQLRLQLTVILIIDKSISYFLN